MRADAEGLGTLAIPAPICAGCLYFRVVAWSHWTR
jgi:hypothetical protein